MRPRTLLPFCPSKNPSTRRLISPSIATDGKWLHPSSRTASTPGRRRTKAGTSASAGKNESRSPAKARVGAPKAAYTYANGQVLARKMFGAKDKVLEREPGLANGGTYFYLTDGLGSVTDLTDQQGAVVRKYRYDAFGGLFAGNVGLYNTTGLTGKAYDAASGLMDYGARWYDPTAGRFTQPDPFDGWLTVPMSQHRYSMK